MTLDFHMPLLACLCCALVSCTELLPDETSADRLSVMVESTVTRTSVSQDSDGLWRPYWTGGDRIGCFVVSESGYVARNLASAALSCDTLYSASFCIEGLAVPATDVTYGFYTYYPYGTPADGCDYNGVKVSIPSVQTPSDGAYDPAAEILAGYPCERQITAGSTEVSLGVQFARKNSILRIVPSLQDGSFDGIESTSLVESVNLVFDRPVAGTCTLDLTSPDGIRACGADACDSIVVNYGVGHHLCDPIWAGVACADSVGSLTVRINLANGKVLTGRSSVSGAGVSFREGTQTQIPLTIADNGKWSLVSRQVVYSKVTDGLSDWSGRYLVVCESDTVALDGSLSYMDAKYNCVELPAIDSACCIRGDLSAYEFLISPFGDNWSVLSASGLYLGRTTTSGNGLQTTSSYALANQIAANTDGSYGLRVNLSYSQKAYLSFNSRTDQMRFRYYTSTSQNPAALYRKSYLADDGGDAGGDDPDPGTGDDPETGDGVCTGGYLGLYEMPATDVKLPSGKAYSSIVRETYGSTYAHVFQPKDSTTRRVVTHTFAYGGRTLRTYSMLYDKDKAAALWVAYCMNGDAYPSNIKRQDGWAYDPAIPEDWQPNLLSGTYSDYNTYNYARGHQCPSAIRCTTKDENNQTFYASNMTPQNQTLNGGVWETLESSERSLGESCTGRDTLYIVTGPLFQDGYSTHTDKFGKSVAVPTHYFKCLMKCSFDSSGKMVSADGCGYLFVHSAKGVRITRTIDEIEALCGFDLFHNVPEALQDAAESTSANLL